MGASNSACPCAAAAMGKEGGIRGVRCEENSDLLPEARMGLWAWTPGPPAGAWRVPLHLAPEKHGFHAPKITGQLCEPLPLRARDFAPARQLRK